MFVIHYHNDHVFDNPGCCSIIGPYPTMDKAKTGLAGLVAEINDPLFKIDPDQDAVDNDGTYAGFAYDDLIDAGRDEDMASEIWAEIVELAPPNMEG